jgi:hypothetical protein
VSLHRAAQHDKEDEIVFCETAIRRLLLGLVRRARNENEDEGKNVLRDINDELVGERQSDEILKS